MKSPKQHLQLAHNNLTQEIELIENGCFTREDFDHMIQILNDPVQASLFSGLLKIKRDIGDMPLEEYLKARQEKARKRLFTKS